MLLALVFCLLPPGGTPKATKASPVEIAALVDGTGKIAWTPTGERIGQSPLPNPNAVHLAFSGKPDDRYVMVRVSTKRPEPPSVAFSGESGDATSALMTLRDYPSGTEWLASSAGQMRPDRPINVGVADGSWRTVGKVALKKGAMGTRSGQGFLLIVRPGEKDKTVADVALPTDLSRNAYRVQLYGRGGKPVPMEMFVSHAADPSAGSYTFAGKFEDASRIVLQARTYTWKTFPAITAGATSR